MTAFVEVLLVVAILGTGIVAGVFFAFSGFVTQGIGRLPAAEAARAMREINVTAVRAPLMLAIFGTALVVAVLAVFAFLGEPEGGDVVVARRRGALPVGVVGVTGAANVPRNNRLAAAADSGCPGARRRLAGVPPRLAGVEPRAHVRVAPRQPRVRARRSWRCGGLATVASSARRPR